MSRILSFAMLWGTARALTTTRRQFAVAGGAGLASSFAAAPPARAGTPLGEGTTASGLRSRAAREIAAVFLRGACDRSV